MTRRALIVSNTTVGGGRVVTYTSLDTSRAAASSRHQERKTSGLIMCALVADPTLLVATHEQRIQENRGLNFRGREAKVATYSKQTARSEEKRRTQPTPQASPLLCRVVCLSVCLSFYVRQRRLGTARVKSKQRFRQNFGKAV